MTQTNERYDISTEFFLAIREDGTKKVTVVIHPFLFLVLVFVALISYQGIVYEAYCNGVESLLPQMQSSYFLIPFCLLHLFGVDFLVGDVLEPLRKAKDVFGEFIATTRVMYLGKIDLILQNVNGVLHPIDFFLKHIYDLHFPRQCIVAMGKYKRTNPTLEMKLAYLEKFAAPNIEHVPYDELIVSVDSILDDVYKEKRYSEFKNFSREFVANMMFGELRVDLSSACGFPYAQGLKRRDRYADAVYRAIELCRDIHSFEDYSFRHVWYTTGRAKMQDVSKPDSGRLIAYAGFSYMLIGMLFAQPWASFMNEFEWCGVGFSWMNGGAKKFAEQFRCEQGYAPTGFRYVSVDIREWDTKLHREILLAVEHFFLKLMVEIGIPDWYVIRFQVIFRDMIDARILFPLGHLFEVHQGMKSGWCNTANDNTLAHELVVRCIIRRLGNIQHVLYGDDNFMLVPDSITDSDIHDEYARFGLVVGTIHSSRAISEVDWLSKRIVYLSGEYYVYRDSIETHSRLLMPEEMDPKRRDRPDAVIAVERVLGHLLDNPFNDDVRNVCYSILNHLKDRYSVYFIDITEETLKQHPWRFFDWSLIPRKFPSVPSIQFIEELYGVQVPNHLRVEWPNIPLPISWGEGQDQDAAMYFSAVEYSNEVMLLVNDLGGGKLKSIIKKTSPFSQPIHCYGFHAARFEACIKHFGISFDSLLDYGSHPGACAASALKYCSDVLCVSLPRAGKEFCPYVGRDVRVGLVYGDANEYVPHRKFDLLHDDVDIVGARSRLDEIRVGKGKIFRAKKNMPFVSQALFSITELDGETFGMLYDLYSEYGHIDFFKPPFSNPWKSEFMVYVRRSKEYRMRKNVFLRRLNHFLNDLAPGMLRWAEVLVSCANNYKGLGFVPANPNKSDHDFELDWIKHR